MRVAILTLTYHPDHTGSAVYATDLARFLGERGHDVTVITSFPHYPNWKKQPRDKGTLFRTEQQGRVRILRGYIYVPASVTPWTRILYELSFLASLTANALRAGAQALVVAVSPPILVGAVGRLLALRSRCGFVCYVQDLQLDAALSLRMLRPGLMTRLLSRIEGSLYRGASLVVTISEGMRRRIQGKGAGRNNLVVIPNWIDAARASREVPSGMFRCRFPQLGDRPLVGYAGNMGVKQSLHTLVEAAKVLQDRQSDVQVLLVGDGAVRRNLEALVAASSLRNVHILPTQSPSEYQELLSDIEICVILQAHAAGEVFFPSKLLGILARGRPVIIAADSESELADAGRASGCAEIVPPEDPVALADAILQLHESPRRRSEMGSEAAPYLKQFDRSRLLKALEHALLETASRRGTSRLVDTIDSRGADQA